jgi:hypothetical protein
MVFTHPSECVFTVKQKFPVGDANREKTPASLIGYGQSISAIPFAMITVAAPAQVTCHFYMAFTLQL